MTAMGHPPAGLRREIAARAIATQPGVRLHDLAALTGLNPNYLTRVVTGLIDAGQVIRRTDGGLFPTDRVDVGEASRDTSRPERCPALDPDPSPPPLPAASYEQQALAARESREGLPARTRHELDRAATRLRERFAWRPTPRPVPSEPWAWGNERASGCEQAIRALLADAAQRRQDPAQLSDRAARLLARADELLAQHRVTAPSPGDTSPTGEAREAKRCAELQCGGPMPDGLRPDAKFCSNRCRQRASRKRVRERGAAPAPVPRESCEWCTKPIPEGKRVETVFCSKRCRQASSRFELTVARTTAALAAENEPTRRRRPLTASAPTMRFAYADPPYPGRAGYYPEGAEVDHQALIARLVAEFPDGWALSTAADALQHVLALCPQGVRVCAWQHRVRHTRSRRALSAWEPLIIHGGRELSIAATQTLQDALVYGGRWRTYPGALIGMKPPQFSVWMFAQLGARPGDELVDLYPGSGAVAAAWERYTSILQARAS